MNSDRKLLIESDGIPILIDRRDLVDGASCVFLKNRAILPIGLVDDKLICAVADTEDADSVAALAFASGREVVTVRSTREKIMVAMGYPYHKSAVLPQTPRVRHAQAVVLLRRYIIAAFDQGANGLQIVLDTDQGVIMGLLHDERSIEISRVSHRDARALIGAADALALASQKEGSRFAVRISDNLYQASVALTQDGRIVRFGSVDIDAAL